MIPRNPGPTGSLALALYHRWEPERLFVIVTVYIDESGTHDSATTIMAGWVGRLGQWAAFDPKWQRLLKDNGLTYFHSRKFRHRKDEFDGWSAEKKNAFLDRAQKACLKGLEFGFVIALPDAAYQAHYVAGQRPREVQLDSAYGLCFRYCLSLVPGLAKEAFRGRDLEINFVLESGHKNAGDAVRIFDKVRKMGLQNQNERATIEMLGALSFGDKKKFPGLQAADINAYSGFQHVTRKAMELVALPNQSTVKAAKKIQSVPIFHLELRETELKGFKQFILDEVQEKQARRKPTSSAA